MYGSQYRPVFRAGVKCVPAAYIPIDSNTELGTWIGLIRLFKSSDRISADTDKLLRISGSSTSNNVDT
jgi:hypothetical protein